MRSLLFVPAHDERKLAKGLGCGADALIIDLEDAVPLAEKPKARQMAAAFITQHRDTLPLFVRVNALDSGLLLDDLAAVVQAQPQGIMLPKCSGVLDLQLLDAYLNALEVREGLAMGRLQLLPIVTESAEAVLALAGSFVAPQAEPVPARVCGMLWGAEDLAADVGAKANRDAAGHYGAPFQLARSMALLAATRAQVAAVDAVYTNFRDADGLRQEAEQAAREGFSCKAAIHPGQVAIINAAFTPDSAAVEWARQVIAAFAAQPTAGAVALHGQMLDRPHLRAAHKVVARAGLAEVH